MKWVALLIVLAGCATAARLPTPSGKPEINIYGIGTAAIMSDIAEWSKRNGYSIGEHTDSTLSTFTESTILIDQWETKIHPTKATYIVPGVSLFTIRRNGDTATIYLSKVQTKKRQSPGIYTGESSLVTKELSSQADLEQMQQELEEIARFIGIRKL